MKDRRKFDQEYKREAVRLAELHGVKKACESLGIDKSMLYQWRKALKEEGADAFRGTGLEEDNRRLRLEVRRLQEEAEILKKASAYFAKHLK